MAKNMNMICSGCFFFVPLPSVYSMFAQTLLKWFRENGRELPWRQTHDPYAIWLSEIILQQTQVKQGWDYWERFMRRWPTVEALAEATEDEVLREWQGLGYYSRARNLHFAAKQIVDLGHFPDTIEEIKQLKGVGDYTAAAIGSIAFGLPAAVVDGNVYRVLARHFGIDTPINTTEGKKLFASLAQELLPVSPSEYSLTSHPSPLTSKSSSLTSEYNQAIMDFGAIQCTPQSPHCDVCPLMETCTAFREGRVGELPVKQKTLVVKERHLIYIYVRCQGETAIHRRGPGDIWQGLWEPLCLEVSGEGQDVRDMFSASGILLPPTSHLSPLKFNVKHVLTHRILMADFYLLETEEKPALPPDYIWVKETELDQYAVPRLIEILLESLPL
jgi:A/G-specific adenine glycosylase